MDSSFLQTQHPVVEELLTNKYFGDTLLVCANGHLTDNKLAVGLLFPSLLTSDIFGLPIENVLLVPDYTMEEIGREFEKLLLQTFKQQPTEVSTVQDEEEVQELVIDESQTESCEPTTSQPSLPASQEAMTAASEPSTSQAVTVQENSQAVIQRIQETRSSSRPVEPEGGEGPGVLPGVGQAGGGGVGVEIGSKTDYRYIEPGEPVLEGGSIHVYIEDENRNNSLEDDGGGGGYDYGEELEILERGHQEGRPGEDGPPDITYYPYMESSSICPFVDETEGGTTDGDIPVLRPEQRRTQGLHQGLHSPQGLNHHQSPHHHQGLQHQGLHHQTVRKTVTFSPDKATLTFTPDSRAVTFSPDKKTVRFSPEICERPSKRPMRLRQPKLKLTVVEGSQEEIQNLPGLPEPELLPDVPPPGRRSPKKLESPVLENRKPGRPKSRPEHPGLMRKTENNGLTRYKQKSAEWKAAEVFKCGICSKVLSCRGSYERHSRMHQDSKPYKCSHCPKTFGEACKKAVHERVHSGSKPFPCLQCSKSFRTATQRNVHRRSHTKERPFTCEVCNKVFSQAYSVKVHKEKFHKK